ncbi:MAG: hypothetical protein HYV15_06155, partial [Elusimicrobia bacterium]|nr:hypothetical protein [Elusimicrobiota bacterium]
MNLRILAGACLLAAGGTGAQAERGAAPARPEQVALARRFVETPTDRLPPEEVEAFLALDPASLPPSLRRSARAKRLELRTLMRLSQSGDTACPRRAPEDAGDPAVLKLAGFSELRRAEVGFLRGRTGLDEEGLACRSSLLVLPGKGGRRYYLYPADPLWALIAGRRVQAGKGSNPPVAASPPQEPSAIQNQDGEGEGEPA